MNEGVRRRVKSLLGHAAARRSPNRPANSTHALIVLPTLHGAYLISMFYFMKNYIFCAVLQLVPLFFNHFIMRLAFRAFFQYNIQ